MSRGLWVVALLVVACSEHGGQAGSSSWPPGDDRPDDEGSGGGATGVDQPPPWSGCEQEVGSRCECPDGQDGVYRCLDWGWCECPTGICGTSVEGNVCLDLHCCEGFAGCLEGTVGACLDCLAAGDGALCDALLACAAEHACSVAILGGVCGTGITQGDAHLDACVETMCCADFVTCVGEDGSEVGECAACLDEGGGERCDGYTACLDAHCAGEGGSGAGAAGSGGAGGAGGGVGDGGGGGSGGG